MAVLLRSLLLLTLLVVVAPSAATARGAASRAGQCPAGLGLLVDRSASMADHDPFGQLRMAIAGGVGRGRPEPAAGDRLLAFDAELAPASSLGSGWVDGMAAALAGGDRGPTDLAAVLGEASALAPRALVVLTDAEADLDAWPASAPVPAIVVVLGGTPAARLARAVRNAGGSVASVRTVAEADRLGAGLCARSAAAAGGGPAAARSVRDVVLVAGLTERTGELRAATRAGTCARAADLAVWCRALIARGWRVWVPSTAPGRAGGALLDSTGRLDGNGAALVRWLARGPGPGAVLAGHSMGGLIAHAALQEGARGAGLITVGTPHAGSYGADAYYAALAAARACAGPCPLLAAQLATAALWVRHRFGAALRDLSRAQRTQAARLGQPAVPFAAWAGTANAAPVFPAQVVVPSPRDDYLAPNDGIVGRGSATGALAGLRPLVVVPDGAARHSTSVPPRAAPTELGSTAVAGWVASVAGRFASGAAGARAAWGTAAASPTAPRGARLAAGARRRVVVPLRAAAVLGAGTAPVRVSAGGEVVATAPIGLRCDDQPVAAVQVAPGLWYLDVGTMGCEQVSTTETADALRGEGGVVLGGGVGAATQVDAGQLVVTRRVRGGWSVDLRLRVPGRPVLTRGARPIRLHPRAISPWNWPRAWHADLPARGSGEVGVRVAAPGLVPVVAAAGLP